MSSFMEELKTLQRIREEYEREVRHFEAVNASITETEMRTLIHQESNALKDIEGLQTMRQKQEDIYRSTVRRFMTESQIRESLDNVNRVVKGECEYQELPETLRTFVIFTRQIIVKNSELIRIRDRMTQIKEEQDIKKATMLSQFEEKKRSLIEAKIPQILASLDVFRQKLVDGDYSEL